MSMTISTRIRHNPVGKAKGQRRHDTRAGEVPKYVDQERSHLNSVLMEPATEGPMRAECQRRREDRGLRAMATNSAIATDGILTFGAEAQKVVEQLPPDEQDRLFLETARTLAAEMNTTLAGLVVHRDESAIHAHFRTVAVRLDGLPISKRVDTKRLQDRAAEAWAHLGITRGKAKKQRIADGEPRSATINRSVKQLHDDLPAELAAAQEKAAKAAERLAKAEVKAQAAEGQVEKLEKRVATYQRRLEQAQAEIERLKAAMPEPKALRIGVSERRQRLFRPDAITERVVETKGRYYPEASTDQIARAARAIATENVGAELRHKDREIEQLAETLEQQQQQWQAVSAKHFDGRPLESIVADIEFEAEQAAQAERQQQPTPQPPKPPSNGPRI